VRYRDPHGVGEIHADLTLACDGRASALRRDSGLPAREYRVPFDMWWFRLPRHPDEAGDVAGLAPAFGRGEALLALTREDYYQLAYPIPKGSDAQRRAEGVEAFRARVAALRPDLADRVEAIASMNDVLLLDVRLDRLRRWHTDGLLCLGDAAHAMSPAGGVGINLAIQDAVAAARLLAAPLREHRVTTADLARVQQRRERPAVILQTIQRTLHLGIGPLLSGRITPRPPWSLLRLASRAPRWMVRIPARLIAVGPRPEHAPDFARR
jgi:2-polyprenyl-6-methoxyphenol hydroxylase-like FAD-dependent oxidoreductase